MFVYEKKLQFPVRIKNCNPKLAAVIISQYGGPDGELGASLRYLSQRYTMPYDELKGLLTDIGTEVSMRGTGPRSSLSFLTFFDCVFRRYIGVKPECPCFFPEIVVPIQHKHPHLRQQPEMQLHSVVAIDGHVVEDVFVKHLTVPLAAYDRSHSLPHILRKAPGVITELLLFPGFQYLLRYDRKLAVIAFVHQPHFLLGDRLGEESVQNTFFFLGDPVNLGLQCFLRVPASALAFLYGS